MSKIDIYIGIDPDVKLSGFAVWDCSLKEIILLKCYDLEDICKTLKVLNDKYAVKLRLEAGWLAKGLNWHKGGYGSANKVGRNHEIGRQIEKYCIKHTIPYDLVKPLGYSAYTHELFCSITDWDITQRTNSETRVAGMLVYGY